MKRFPIGLVAASLTVALWFACGDGTGPNNTPTVTLSANRYTLPNDGTQAAVSITAATGSTPGAGDVSFTVDRGQFENGQRTMTATLAGGAATVNYTCDADLDLDCANGGRARFVATWGTVSAVLDINITRVNTGGPDAGDGGSDGGTDGGETDGGLDGGEDAGAYPADGGAFVWSVSKNRIFLDVGDSSDIVLTLKSKTGDAGVPLPAIPVTIGTNFGRIFGSDGGEQTPSFTEPTGTLGEVAFRFTDNGDAGVATLSAQTPWGIQGATSIEITRVQTLSHVSTACGSVTNCTLMGVKNSGFQESAQVKFRVTDASGRAAVGLPVAFTLLNAPSGTQVTESAVTSSTGEVTANVTSGFSVGTFTVKASILDRSATSASIAVVGAKPTNRGFQISCAKLNLAAFASATPPAVVSTTCTARLVDRFGNPVGIGPSINFKSEAGTISASATAKKSTTTPTDTDGTAVVPFNTGGVFPPSDVDPLEADFTQNPLREAEPVVGGAVVRNPRDGLVSILAYAAGEEWFDDANNDGIWTAGEQFLDQGEPFVDDNDNGVRDTGEDYIETGTPNGQWDGPDGQWTANATVWTETRVLYTDVPDQLLASVEPAQFSGACGVDELDNGATRVLKPFFPDRNLNRITAGAALSIIKSNRATVGLNGGTTVADGYGMGLNRISVDTATGAPCGAASAICKYIYQFTTWSGGYPGIDGFVTAPANLTACAAETVTLRAVMNATTYSAVSEGFLGTQPPPPDAGPGTILISATPARIYVDAEDSARIVATLKSLPDGGGVPVSGEAVTLVTDLGQFLNSDGSFSGTSFPATTDGKGQVVTRFGDDGTAGMATISGSTARGATGTRTVEIGTLQSITHVTTTCGAVTGCTTMGVRNSAYNETAQVKFKLVDTLGRNAEGVRVRFQLQNAPSGTTVNVSGVTNAAGEVVATVSSAPKAGSFTVKAIAVTGSVEGTSPTIAIIRARPTNRGFNITCPNSVPALASVSPPRIEAVNCSMRLVDIGSVGVTTRPTVQFLTEAGTLGAQSAQAAADGTVALALSTGGNLPDDVAPFAANPAQAPLPRDAEPSAGSRNPRDAVVSVVAFVPGEEYFVDNNNNGTWDSGEQFYDQGEPLLDKNDNGVWDSGEAYHDSDQDGAWDGPNGVWDGSGSTYVWSETRILYTGLVDTGSSRIEPATFAGACGAGELRSGQSVSLAGIFRDQNLNRPPVGTKVTVADSATNTATAPAIEGSDTVADGFGYRIDRTLLDAASGLPCTSASASCVYATLFSGFESGGVTARARLTIPGTVTTCEENTVTMTATLPAALGAGTASANSSGAVGTQSLADGGTPDAGPGTILITAAPSKLFVEVNDVSTVTATLKSLPDGGGFPVSGQEISLGTTLGVFTDATGTPSSGTTATGTTDSNGQVVVYVKDENTAGTAVLSASTVAGAAGSRQVDFVNVQSIEHRSTICGSSSCILLGAKGSGYNEQALVKFRVLDSASQPVPNARVEFALDPPTAPATVSAWAITNAAGEAVANVTSGASTGAFAIKATVLKASDSTMLVEARSPTIGVTGARAVNNGFTFSCAQVNLPAGVSATPPREVTVKCDVRLVDRYGNPVGTGPSVNFKSEAGTIPAAAQLKVYKPEAPTGDDGTVAVDFVSGGVYPATDVDPLFFPMAAANEPYWTETLTSGATVTHNPRDGLVAIIVYLNGEESFTDTNQNGEWDTGERFFDQGEPLVDNNDDGDWDTGEFFVDVDKNGTWTAPNNVWDRSTTIWSETRVLFTGAPDIVPARDYGPFPDYYPKGVENCPGIGANQSVSLDLYFPDRNLNRTASGTSVAATGISGTGGVIALTGPATLIDGYGFGIGRVAVDSGSGAPCAATSPSCRWTYQFGTWSEGELPANLSVSLGGTDQTCSIRTIRVTTTILSTQTSKDINVAIGTMP